MLASTAMNPAANLIFIGPMGAGKSSLGRRVARHFGLAFVDADRVLETRTGASIPLIFECEGEAGFRAREKALLAELCAGHDRLIATGGGAVLDADNRRLLAASGFVVHLQASVEEQLSRLRRDRSRPLLQAPDRERRLRALAAERDPLYAEIADLVFQAGSLPAGRVFERLCAAIAARWRRPEAA